MNKTEIQNIINNKIDKNMKNRAYIGTCNNPTISDEELLNILKAHHSRCFIEYAIFQREQGPQSNISHIHLFVVFVREVKFNTVEIQFPEGFTFKPMRTTKTLCRNYCSKEDFRISGPYELGKLEF